MSKSLDFEFGFGRDRYLRGRGWRGVIDLFLLFLTMLAAAAIGGPSLHGYLPAAAILFAPWGSSRLPATTPDAQATASPG